MTERRGSTAQLLKDKVSLVTGSTSGIGLGITRALAASGSAVVLNGFGKAEEIKATQAAIGADFGVKVAYSGADMTNPHSIAEMITMTLDSFGRLDVLVNNAGISAVADAETMSRDQWQSVIDTNLTGLFYCAQAAGRRMLQQGFGKIINIASMYGISASSCVSQVSYVASKSGVIGLTRELAVEWAPKGLQVVALAPGFFRSDQTVWAFEQNQELGRKLLAKVPAGRLGRLEELEGTIVYLASSAADYMNGHTLVIDGGFLSW
jgi:3-hydroxybutyrate dehydrogenase